MVTAFFIEADVDLDPYVIWVQIQIEMFEVYQVGIPRMYFKMCRIHNYTLEKFIALGPP